VPQQTVVGDIPRIQAGRTPDVLAFTDGARRYSWAEFDQRVTRLAHVLRDHLGVQPQDRVAILAGNCLEYVELTFASSRIKAIYTGLNTRHHRAEMAAQLADCGASVLLVGPGFEELGAHLAVECGATVVHLGPEGPGEHYKTLLAAASTEAIPGHGDAEAPYVLTYTSGTTGDPRGAMISSRNDLAMATSLAVCTETHVDDRFMVVLPLFHKGGQFAVLHPACLGLTTVLLPGPNPELMCRTIAAEQVTVFLAVPTVMKMLVDHLEQTGADHYDFTSLRHVLYGSNPIAPAQLRAFAGLFGCSLSQIGGIGTEGGVGLSLSRVDHDRGLRDPSAGHILQSCGRIQPGAEMRLVDEGGQEVPTGEIGEMVFRGDAYVAGYWNRPEASRLLWREGWLHSGDLGRRDAEGYVYYVDRKAGRIKTGGETVFAREVEAALSDHPAVLAVSVVGVPDEKWGEAIWAVVETREDARAGEDLATELQEHVRQRLARFKVPRRILFRSALPTTALGKIAVGQVRALAIGALAADRAADSSTTPRSGIEATA
jgi:acyl-CoA synthetase (AMP-forming)/AMP-acid ligase II